MLNLRCRSAGNMNILQRSPYIREMQSVSVHTYSLMAESLDNQCVEKRNAKAFPGFPLPPSR